MFRKFKRHYHTTKRAYFEAAENSELGFSFRNPATDRSNTARRRLSVRKQQDLQFWFTNF